MKVGDATSAIGKGLAAGAVGALAITASTTLANKLRGKEPSTTAVEASEKVMEVEPKTERARMRLNNRPISDTGSRGGRLGG